MKFDETGLRVFERFPHYPAALGPTPLMPSAALSAELDVPVWLKRDDLTGRGLGGNKVRTLEYLIGDALATGCDTVLTGAGPRSNWAMLAALIARTAGLDAHLVYYGDPVPPSGNYLLAQRSGATIDWTHDSDRSSVDRRLADTAEALRSAGHRPYVIPRGGAVPLGCLGYARAALELSEQCTQAGLSSPEVWLACGSCGTQAGLVAGTVAFGLDLAVTGVATSRPADESRQRITSLADRTLELLGASKRVGSPTGQTAPFTVVDGFIGGGYGKPSSDGAEAARLMARAEGLFLDPIFGAKAFAGLIAAARAGQLTGPTVYLVTGGGPTVVEPQPNQPQEDFE